MIAINERRKIVINYDAKQANFEPLKVIMYKFAPHAIEIDGN